MNYYNEFDPFASNWLRNLIDGKMIPPGHVDDRDIKEVTHNDLKGYTQHHFFAGIGGWPLALQYAGWPTARPVWTASCPCQPLSCAGKRQGADDERHLWPELYRLASEYRPDTVFGEQVAGIDGLEWFDGISLDLEEIGYAVGAADLPAASVGAPHIRQRLFWVAGLGHARSKRLQGHGGYEQVNDTQGREIKGRHTGEASWNDSATIKCDERVTGRGIIQRRIEPGLSPLAHGIPGRVGLLKGYGNAIVPQVAAKFIQAYTECYEEPNPNHT